MSTPEGRAFIMNHKARQTGNLQLTELTRVNFSRTSQLGIMSKAAVEALPAGFLLACLITGVFAFFR
jgi:hypothetical protein